MPSHHADEVAGLARRVRELLPQLDPVSLRNRPNSYEPTVGESMARALLELDRLTGEPQSLPRFASEFLNRRLTKRLLERYSAAQLSSELERRIARALDLIYGNRQLLEPLRSILLDLESALLQGRPVER